MGEEGWKLKSQRSKLCQERPSRTVIIGPADSGSEGAAAAKVIHGVIAQYLSSFRRRGWGRVLGPRIRGSMSSRGAGL